MRPDAAHTAREESAHACAAVRAGRRIERITLDPGVCRIAHHNDFTVADVVLRIVGPLAINEWPWPRSTALPVIVDDSTATEIICEEIAGKDGAAALQAEAEDRAAALLQEPRFLADVDRLAQRLLRHGEIDGADVERLLGVERAAAPWHRVPSPTVIPPWREAVPA